MDLDNHNTSDTKLVMPLASAKLPRDVPYSFVMSTLNVLPSLYDSLASILRVVS